MARHFRLGEELAKEDPSSAFTLRPFKRSDEDAWVRFINETNAFGTWDKGSLRDDIIRLLVPSGGILAIGKNGIVGCASACRLRANLPHATLMYVAVASSEQGLGLGRRLTCETMCASQRAGYTGMVLNTDDFRIPAIRTYLSAGFIPHLVSEFDHGARWKSVMREIEERKPLNLGERCVAGGRDS